MILNLEHTEQHLQQRNNLPQMLVVLGLRRDTYWVLRTGHEKHSVDISYHYRHDLSMPSAGASISAQNALPPLCMGAE